MDTLVTTDWLAQHINDDDLVLLDCSVTTVPDVQTGFHNVSGRPECELGHLPGAGFADLKGELCDTSSAVEFALPSTKRFCKAMEALGVGDGSRVVLYDTSYTAWAARVWWMLRWIGFERAAILDGGLAAWTAAGHALSLEPVKRAAKHLTCRPRPALIADHDEVLNSITGDAVTLIDTLPAFCYKGEIAFYARPGHIPGAININALDLLDKNGRFRTMQELAAMHQHLDPGSRIITYCGGGIAASANAFVMHRLGFTNIAVYTDSLQVWTADPGNPMCNGI